MPDEVEALVNMVVGAEDDIDLRGNQRIPDICHLPRGPVLTRCKSGFMPVGKRAGVLVSCKICLQPAVLLAGRITASDRFGSASGAALGVQRDKVPAAKVEGVPPLLSRSRAEIVEVT